MTRPSNYLCGKPANRNHTNGDRLQARYDEIHGDHPTFMERNIMERNSSRLLVLCIVGLGAIGAASWGMAVVNDIALDRIEISVD